MRWWLYNMRVNEHKSTYEYARDMGIPQPSYWKIENGKANPSVKRAKRMANVLGVPWTRFFEEEE